MTRPTKYVRENFFKKTDSPFVVKSGNPNELIIQSDKQSEINDFIYAEGNVSVSYRGLILKADNLVYDKSNKKISSKGNISFIIGEQIFKISEIEYSFITKKGFLLNRHHNYYSKKDLSFKIYTCKDCSQKKKEYEILIEEKNKKQSLNYIKRAFNEIDKPNDKIIFDIANFFSF